MINDEDWNQFNTGSNPVPIEIFAKYGRIDHLWVIKATKKSEEALKTFLTHIIYIDTKNCAVDGRTYIGDLYFVFCMRKVSLNILLPLLMRIHE